MTAQGDKCLELFKTLNTDEVRRIFSDPADYSMYKGQEGYTSFRSKDAL